MLYEDCGHLSDWPGVPVEDEEGRLITHALGDKRAAILANHGYICACSSIEESIYMAISIEHAAELALLAMSVGQTKPQVMITRRPHTTSSAAVDRECNLQLLGA